MLDNAGLISDESGGIVQTYDYDAFGNITAQSGSLSNNYQFQDKEALPELGLIFYGARYYKPLLGRFINTDPLGMVDGPNLYRFCLNDPVNYLDPYGLCVLPPKPGPVPDPNPPGGIPGSGVPYGDIHGEKPDTQPGAEQINSFGCDGGKVFSKPRSNKPRGKRYDYDSKKDAYEAAKRKGHKKPPIHHPRGKYGPHYHPDDGSHDHYYYKRRR